MALGSVPEGSIPLHNEDADDEPRTPMTGRWTDDRAPLRTSSPESIPPSPEPPKWKGKGKAFNPPREGSPAVLGVTEMDIGGPSPDNENEPFETATQSLVPSTYPPATDEVIEEQKVNEVRCYPDN